MTSNTYEDFDPVWSPNGQQIVYISSYSGSPCLWAATINGSMMNVAPIKVTCSADPRHPSWSPDGTRLAWSELVNNRRTIVTWNYLDTEKLPAALTDGDFPAWNRSEDTIFHIIQDPNQTYLTANRLPYGTLVYPVTTHLGFHRRPGLDGK